MKLRQVVYDAHELTMSLNPRMLTRLLATTYQLLACAYLQFYVIIISLVLHEFVHITCMRIRDIVNSRVRVRKSLQLDQNRACEFSGMVNNYVVNSRVRAS